MVSEKHLDMTKGILRDIINITTKIIVRKDSYMYSIPQNLKNVLKNKIKTLINPILYNTIDLMIDNLLADSDNSNKYFSLFSSIQSSVREMIRKVIITTFEEVDANFKESIYRKSRYYINKSNVERTLVTIVGEIRFTRTYYKNKLSNNKFFYVDKVFDLPKYDHYDPIIKGFAIDNAVKTSQAQSARDTSYFIGELKHFMDLELVNTISRQSVYNWIKEWNTPNIVPASVETPETLYVMADEKYIGAQDIEKDIMVKSFVAFEGVENVSKNRRMLVNRSVFSCYDKHAWPLFMDFIAKRYDFSKIKNIALLGDGGTWIKTGVGELRLDPNNHVKFYLCEFHFKQAIHHITPDESERFYLVHIFKTKSKSYFENAVTQIIAQNPKRAEIITKKLNYIINNYTSIKSMLELKIGSSMESHISHLIASFFSSRPKGYSTKRIHQYLQLNDYKNNGMNIFKIYIQSYKNSETIDIDEEAINNFTFDNFNNSNLPVLANGHVSDLYQTLYDIAH